MGGKCSPSGGIDPIEDTSLKNIRDVKGEPNSRTDLYQGDELIQSRWYGEEEWAIWDRHYKHNDPNGTHEFPHDHGWGWLRKRGEYIFLPLKPQSPSPDFC